MCVCLYCYLFCFVFALLSFFFGLRKRTTINFIRLFSSRPEELTNQRWEPSSKKIGSILITEKEKKKITLLKNVKRNRRGRNDTEHYFCASGIANSYFKKKKMHSGCFRVIQGRVETQCVFYFFV